jgi:hypothetical protein
LNLSHARSASPVLPVRTTSPLWTSSPRVGKRVAEAPAPSNVVAPAREPSNDDMTDVDEPPSYLKDPS